MKEPPGATTPSGERTTLPRRGTLVTVGRGTRYPFTRLVDAVLETLPVLPHPVLVQHAGLSALQRPGVTCVDMLSRESFSERLAGAELLVCHAGAGTILEALRAGIPTVVMARRPELGETVDGHQLELAGMLSQLDLVRIVDDAAALRSTLASWDRRVAPLDDPLRQRPLVERVRTEIDSMLRRGARPRIALAVTTGGHLAELLELREAYQHVPHFYVANDRLPMDVPGCPVHVFPSDDRDWRVVRHVPAILRMLRDERPGIVLSTGAGSAIPVMLLARTVGARVIYVESLTRVHGPSITARAAYPLSDTFIVRWPEVARRFPRALLSAAGAAPALYVSYPNDGPLVAPQGSHVAPEGTVGLPRAGAGDAT